MFVPFCQGGTPNIPSFFNLHFTAVLLQFSLLLRTFDKEFRHGGFKTNHITLEHPFPLSKVKLVLPW
jgi:hypothetical protein